MLSELLRFRLLFVSLNRLIYFVLYGSLTSQYSAHYRMDSIESILQCYPRGLYICFFRRLRFTLTI